MMHLTMDEILELASKLSLDEMMGDTELNRLNHIRECYECYNHFGIALALCDATNAEGISLVAESRRSIESLQEEIKEPLSVIKVVRKKINDVKSAIMEQINDVSAMLSFEPSLALATRGAADGMISGIIKLEEIEDEKTFIAFDPQSNELIVQINIKNVDDENLGIYLISAGKRIIEVPTVKESGFIKGRLSNIPDGDFRIYIEAD